MCIEKSIGEYIACIKEYKGFSIDGYIMYIEGHKRSSTDGYIVYIEGHKEALVGGFRLLIVINIWFAKLVPEFSDLTELWLTKVPESYGSGSIPLIIVESVFEWLRQTSSYYMLMRLLFQIVIFIIRDEICDDGQQA